MKIKKAVIPAAGLGTRFLPATKSQPKEMLPIVDKPAIQYIIEEAVQSGIESIIVVTGRNKQSIEDHFDRSVELEKTLAESGKEEMLKQFGIWHSWRTSITFVRRNPWAWGTRFCAPVGLLEMNRLPCCSVTTLWYPASRRSDR